MVTPRQFRKDRYLRATGYNFYSWAVVNVLVTLPLFAALDGHSWPLWLAIVFPIGAIVAGIFVAILNDNRVQKMCGDASTEAVVEAGSVWGPVFLVGVILTVVLSVRGPVAYVQPVWLLLVGAAYLVWGNFGIAEFRWLGWTLIACGAVAGLSVEPSAESWLLASRTALGIWILFMGVLWIPFGAYINRKYVHAPLGDDQLLDARQAADGS
jgi:hypothetical protein